MQGHVRLRNKQDPVTVLKDQWKSCYAYITSDMSLCCKKEAVKKTVGEGLRTSPLSPPERLEKLQLKYDKHFTCEHRGSLKEPITETLGSPQGFSPRSSLAWTPLVMDCLIGSHFYMVLIVRRSFLC